MTDGKGGASEQEKEGEGRAFRDYRAIRYVTHPPAHRRTFPREVERRRRASPANAETPNALLASRRPNARYARLNSLSLSLSFSSSNSVGSLAVGRLAAIRF